jgi:4-aminobutyrate aminotransferase
LAAMKQRYALIGDVRGRGFLLGIELVNDRATKDPAKAAAEAVMYRALDLGLSFKTTFGNVLTLTPPLTTTREQMAQALDIIEACIGECAA